MIDEGVSGSEQVVERAASLVPLLRERAREAEQIRRLPDASLAAIKEAGLLSLFKPRLYGGLEVSVRTSVKVIATLARGCGSTAWVVSQINAGLWLASLFPASARAEVFAQPEVYISAVLDGRGSGRRTAGGYVLNGTWPFCSGCQHSNWIIMGMSAEDEKGAPAPLVHIVPTSQMEILDDWHVSGLCGSSSNSVVARDVFVPERRAVDLLPFLTPAPIPTDLPGALYRSPMMQTLFVNAAGAALGMAEASLDEFKAQSRSRGIAHTHYEKKADAPVTHLQVGEAQVKLDAARLMIERCVDDLELCTARGGAMDLDARVRIRMSAAFAVNLCREAVDLLMGASGGSVLLLSNPIQRMARDLRAMNQHGAYSLSTNLERYGRVLMGLSPNTPII